MNPNILENNWIDPETVKRFRANPFLVMRMIFMHRDRVCTIIDVDFKNRQIFIQNQTDDFLHRAFGVIEHPTWEDFEEFLESRCFPRTRANLKLVLFGEKEISQSITPFQGIYDPRILLRVEEVLRQQRRKYQYLFTKPAQS